MKKKMFWVISFLLTLLVLSSCSTDTSTTNTLELEISADTTVKPLTDKEYGEVITSELKNPTKDDFRKVHILFSISGTNNISNIQVKLPDYRNVFNNIEKDHQKRYWFGNETDQEKGNKNIYRREFVLYTKGLSEDQIKTTLETSKIKTSWVFKDTKKKVEDKFSAGENVKFE